MVFSVGIFRGASVRILSVVSFLLLHKDNKQDFFENETLYWLSLHAYHSTIFQIKWDVGFPIVYDDERRNSSQIIFKSHTLQLLQVSSSTAFWTSLFLYPPHWGCVQLWQVAHVNVPRPLGLSQTGHLYIVSTNSMLINLRGYIMHHDASHICCEVICGNIKQHHQQWTIR